MLLLLFLKCNRSLQTLWLGVPLALTLALLSLFFALPGVGSDAPDGMFETLSAVPFGLAAVWLLSPCLKGRSRFRTFLGMLVTMELFSLVTCVIGYPGNGDRGPGDMLIGVGVVALLLTVAINLAGWSCRRRFDRRRFLLWLILWIMAVWLVVFVVMSFLAGPGPLLEMASALGIFSAISLGALLPFLLLSFNNAFHRERLKEFLHLADAAPTAAPLVSQSLPA